MIFPYFVGDGKQRPEGAALPRSKRRNFLKPEDFRPDRGAIDAVNVALLLGQPLLLTGEPGTGKTQLGRYIAWELGLGEALIFETKSGSTASSLFYSYDALQRFQHVQSGIRTESALPYISYNALGQAILRTRDPREVAAYVPEGQLHTAPERSLVIIDEVDKAPRDFPNDILNELDQLYFRVAELDNRPIRASAEYRPIVVLTSNSEKDLPDAFLRRCIFYHIPFPDREQMRGIVEARLGSFTAGASAFLDDALDLFYALRNRAALRKKPATAELLEWITSLVDAAGGKANPLRDDPEAATQTLSALVKTVEDRERAVKTVQEWARST